MKKIKKIFKNNIILLLGIVIGLILYTSVFAATIYYDSINVGYNNSSSGLVASDVQNALDEIYGKFHSISFNTNGGTGGESSTMDAIYGCALPSINTTAPTRSGYQFMGWYDNANYTQGTQYYNASGVATRSFDKTTDTILYAGWKQMTYTLTYNNNGGSGCASKTGTAGSTWGTLCTPTRQGYAFYGWNTNSSGTGTTITANSTVSGNQTVYAVWKGTITYLGQGTSFNIKSSYPSLYSSLNANNFIIAVAKMNSISATAHTNSHQYVTGNLTGFNLSKSYNASTGVLTITGNGYSIYGCYDDSYLDCRDASASGNVSPYVYMKVGTPNVYADLGTGTSKNIKSSYPSVYSSLTKNNFIVGVTSVGNLRATGWTNPHQYLSGKTNGFTLSTSYNASTGVLSVSGNSYNVQFCGDDSYVYCTDANTSGTISPHIYMFKN